MGEKLVWNPTKPSTSFSFHDPNRVFTCWLCKSFLISKTDSATTACSGEESSCTRPVKQVAVTWKLQDKLSWKLVTFWKSLSLNNFVLEMDTLPQCFKQNWRKGCFKNTLGTSIIYNPMSPPSLAYLWYTRSTTADSLYCCGNTRLFTTRNVRLKLPEK